MYESEYCIFIIVPSESTPVEHSAIKTTIITKDIYPNNILYKYMNINLMFYKTIFD